MDTQETTILTALIISTVVIGGVFLFFVFSVFRQHRRNMELNRRNILAEITALEKERSRIANDLHDDLGPTLSVIKFQVDAVKTVDHDDRLLLSEASNQLDSLIARMREISNNLTPSTLARRGLVATLEKFIANLQKSHTCRLRFEYDKLPAISEENSINLYRITQEVVHNSLKHAGATEITLSLKTENGWLKLLCIDNGAGFDYEQKLKEGTGLGLKSLRSRVEVMKGTMRVESEPGKGSAFQFLIPLTD